MTDVSSALIRGVTVQTRSNLKARNLHLCIPPSQTASQQTITVNLPRHQHSLTIAMDVAASTSQRQVKFVGSLGTQRLQMTSGDPTRPTFDIRLNPGMTKVDLEVIAGPARGVPKSGPPGTNVDYERVTLFLNLLR